MTATTQENATPRAPRIALAGMSLESNAFAPVATEADFRARYYFKGEEILAQARRAHSVISSEMTASPVVFTTPPRERVWCRGRLPWPNSRGRQPPGSERPDPH